MAIQRSLSEKKTVTLFTNAEINKKKLYRKKIFFLPILFRDEDTPKKTKQISDFFLILRG